jgi:hypothetical protein
MLRDGRAMLRAFHSGCPTNEFTGGVADIDMTPPSRSTTVITRRDDPAAAAPQLSVGAMADRDLQQRPITVLEEGRTGDHDVSAQPAQSGK